MIDSTDIEWAIRRDRRIRSTLVPRFTPWGWFECDVAEITEAGYFREYEIKVSRADFFRDAKKSSYYQGERRSKHDRIASKDSSGPCQFYFVVPENLVTPDEVPEWAGLIYIFRRGEQYWPEEKIVKKAPRLHKEKANAQILKNMLGSLHGRIHHVWDQIYYRSCSRRKAA